MIWLLLYFKLDHTMAVVEGVGIRVRQAHGRQGRWGESKDRQGHEYIWWAEFPPWAKNTDRDLNAFTVRSNIWGGGIGGLCILQNGHFMQMFNLWNAICPHSDVDYAQNGPLRDGRQYSASRAYCLGGREVAKRWKLRRSDSRWRCSHQFLKKRKTRFKMPKLLNLLADMAKINFYLFHCYVYHIHPMWRIIITWGQWKNILFPMRIKTYAHGNMVVTIGANWWACRCAECLTLEAYKELQSLK